MRWFPGQIDTNRRKKPCEWRSTGSITPEGGERVTGVGLLEGEGSGRGSGEGDKRNTQNEAEKKLRKRKRKREREVE